MMPVNDEWYVFFQYLWVQNVMALFFAIFFFFLILFEVLGKDDLLYMRIVPKEGPSGDLFRKNDKG